MNKWVLRVSWKSARMACWQQYEEDRFIYELPLLQRQRHEHRPSWILFGCSVVMKCKVRLKHKFRMQQVCCVDSYPTVSQIWTFQRHVRWAQWETVPYKWAVDNICLGYWDVQRHPQRLCLWLTNPTWQCRFKHNLKFYKISGRRGQRSVNTLICLYKSMKPVTMCKYIQFISRIFEFLYWRLNC